MADKSIGDLNFAPGTVDDSNTLFVVQQSGAAYKLSGHEFILAMESVLDGHGGINSIVYTPPASGSLTGTMVITLADQSTTSVSIQNGKGIVSIAKVSTSGLVDTYRITYNDNTTSTFTVTNGAKGDTGDAWYVWIRYSGQRPTSDSDIGTVPDDWIGIYSGTSSTAPVHYTSYQWFEIKGEKGDTGNPATITDTAVEYQVSTSGTVVPSGTWTTTVPSVTQGDFLWTRTTLEFNSGNPIVSYSVSRQGVDGTGTGTVQSVSYNGVVYNNVDDSGNLPLNNIQAQHITASVTIAVVDWNDSTTCTKVVNGVTPNNSVIIAPAPTSFALYASSGIRATAQGTNQLTFACNSTPSDAITVNVLILN